MGDRRRRRSEVVAAGALFHFAVGHGFPFIGGTNVSAVHWDMVKDLRRGGRIELDGELVQENGEWAF